MNNDYNLWRTQCEFSARMFGLSCELGYDSRSFIKLIALTDLGDYYYSQNCIDAWLSPGYVLEDFQHSFDIEHGDVLPVYFMEWLGYLYRYWTYNYPDTIKDVYNSISIDDLLCSYDGLHVMDWSMIVETIKEGEQVYASRNIE